MAYHFACPPARKTRNGMFSQITEFGGSQACPNVTSAKRLAGRAVIVQALAGPI
jgi:hypothetical protein